MPSWPRSVRSCAPSPGRSSVRGRRVRQKGHQRPCLAAEVVATLQVGRRRPSERDSLRAARFFGRRGHVLHIAVRSSRTAPPSRRRRSRAKPSVPGRPGGFITHTPSADLADRTHTPEHARRERPRQVSNDFPQPFATSCRQAVTRHTIHSSGPCAPSAMRAEGEGRARVAPRSPSVAAGRPSLTERRARRAAARAIEARFEGPRTGLDTARSRGWVFVGLRARRRTPSASWRPPCPRPHGRAERRHDAASKPTTTRARRVPKKRAGGGTSPKAEGWHGAQQHAPRVAMPRLQIVVPREASFELTCGAIREDVGLSTCSGDRQAALQQLRGAASRASSASSRPSCPTRTTSCPS